MLDPDMYKTVEKDALGNTTKPCDIVEFTLSISHSSLRNIDIVELENRLEEAIQDGLGDSHDEIVNMADFELNLNPVFK